MSLAEDLKKLVGIKPRYPHVERELAQTYGLAPDVLKEVRAKQLQRGEHWDLVKGIVCYNDAGRAALEAALNITPEKNPAESPATEPPPAPAGASPTPDSATNNAPRCTCGHPETPGIHRTDRPCLAPEKNFVAPIAGEVRPLVVVALVRNRRILKARDQDRVAWVRVRDSKNFRPGMELQARFLAGEQWELVGRCPRWLEKF